MRIGYKTKGQAAIEFLSTYAWAFLAIAVLLISLFFFLSLPGNSIPARCEFTYALTCVGASVGTNSMGSAVDLYISNGQQYDLIGNTIATVVISQYGTSNAMCTPANILSGGATLCYIPLTTKIGTNKIGQPIGGTIFLNTSVCLSGTFLNCQTKQKVSYLGNFTAQLSGNANPISATVGPIYTIPASPAHNTRVPLIATVKIFGKNARGGTVLFTITSGSATISPTYALSDNTGNATAYITSPVAGSVSITATFGTNTVSNTITFT